VNAADLVKGNSAFIAMLSKLDQGRLRFIYSRRIEEPIKVSLSIIFWMDVVCECRNTFSRRYS